MNSPGTHYYTHENMVSAPKGVATPKVIYKSEDGILLCYGTTFPPDASTGYAPGCLFINTTPTPTGVGLYINEGTVASSDFDAVAAA
jgi:hypothetical protein